MSKLILHIDNISIGHGKDILYREVSFDINEGDCIMLCGANGSGKTTLLKTLAGMNARDMIMIPSRIPKVEGFTLRDFITISCFNQSDMRGRLSDNDKENMYKALECLKLEGLADRYISTLSDGEFQKACIASALIRKARVIMLDEPTAFLDAENRISVLETLQKLSIGKDSPAVIFSTHDLYDGERFSNKVIALGADGICYCAESAEKKDAIKTIFH